MSVFLTPDKKPFYGGTYFPAEERYGIPSFRTLLLSIEDSWENRREEILNSAESAKLYLEKLYSRYSKGDKELSVEILKTAFQDFEKRYDNDYGGFGPAPKFPMGHSLSFLLRYWKRSGEKKALAMVQATLDKMAGGGLHDQLGGGFHRYSTDREWFLPHFEKMLYDQALLVSAYCDLYLITGKAIYKKIIFETLDFVLREMTDKDGGFYSAYDADGPSISDFSKKREGAFYVWAKEEILKILPEKEGEIFCYFFGIQEDGNI